MEKIKYLISLVIISFLFFSFFTNDSHASLDPGTTSLIIQAIIGFLAGASAFIVLYWRKLKNYIKNKNLFSKPKK